MLIQILLNKPIAINQTMGGPKPTLHIAGTLFHKREVNRVFFFLFIKKLQVQDLMIHSNGPDNSSGFY